MAEPTRVSMLPPLPVWFAILLYAVVEFRKPEGFDVLNPQLNVGVDLPAPTRLQKSTHHVQ
jgi:hypothetical protein